MAYPLSLRRIVVTAYQQGEGSLVQLAELYQISVPTVHDWVRRAQRGEELEPRASPGRPPTLGPEALQLLRDLVRHDNDATLPLLARELGQRLGARVPPRVVGRALQRMDITTKKRRSVPRSGRASAWSAPAVGSARTSRRSRHGD
jgi:transposase